MATRKRVVFLDVDGVLHPFSASSLFHAPCMAALRTIIAQTGASIVLSSSWQATPQSLAQVNAALQMNGVPACSDKTVPTNAAGMAPAGAGESNRAREILDWVDGHSDACRDGWVALDDMDLLRFMPPDAFVRTQAESGLTEADAREAIQILGGRDASLPPLAPAPAKPGGFNVLVTRGEMQREMMRAALAGAQSGDAPARDVGR